MNLSETTSYTTEERAYFIYLKRQRRGIPGNEQEDWIQAESISRKPVQPVTSIKGIGPRVAAELKNAGIASVEDLAAWELSDFGERLPRLTARAKSGRWIEQARELT